MSFSAPNQSGSTASGYAKLRMVKKRLNIEDSESESNEKIQEFMLEADNYVNNQIGLHALTPIADADDELFSLASGLAAALFNYWQTPGKDALVRPVEQFKQYIQDHIMVNYGRRNPNLLAGGNMFGKTQGFSRT